MPLRGHFLLPNHRARWQIPITFFHGFSDVIPEWLTGGLAVAGGMLPAVGIAILLRFLPVKNFITYLMIGFLAVAYLKMPMFGVALLGLALAILQFKNLIGKQNNLTQVAQADANGKGGLSADEYED